MADKVHDPPINVREKADRVVLVFNVANVRSGSLTVDHQAGICQGNVLIVIAFSTMSPVRRYEKTLALPHAIVPERIVNDVQGKSVTMQLVKVDSSIVWGATWHKVRIKNRLAAPTSGTSHPAKDPLHLDHGCDLPVVEIDQTNPVVEGMLELHHNNTEDNQHAAQVPIDPVAIEGHVPNTSRDEEQDGHVQVVSEPSSKSRADAALPSKLDLQSAAGTIPSVDAFPVGKKSKKKKGSTSQSDSTINASLSHMEETTSAAAAVEKGKVALERPPIVDMKEPVTVRKNGKKKRSTATAKSEDTWEAACENMQYSPPSLASAQTIGDTPEFPTAPAREPSADACTSSAGRVAEESVVAREVVSSQNGSTQSGQQPLDREGASPARPPMDPNIERLIYETQDTFIKDGEKAPVPLARHVSLPALMILLLCIGMGMGIGAPAGTMGSRGNLTKV